MSSEGTQAEGDEAREEIHEAAPVLRHGAVQGFDASGIEILFCGPSELLKLVKALADEGFGMLLDVCGVDYLTHPGRTGLPADITPERFEVTYLLISHAEARRLRIRVQVPESEAVVPSLVAMHPGAEAPEREAFDMFGIDFTDHPDMTRILMPDDWSGHPLRKDFAVGRIPVQFKGAPAPR